MAVPQGWLPQGYIDCNVSCSQRKLGRTPRGQQTVRCPCTDPCAAPCDCKLVKRGQVPDDNPENPRDWKWGPPIVVQENCNRIALKLVRHDYKCLCLKKAAGGQKPAKYYGYYEVFEDKRGEWRFRLKSKNGETILASEGYTRQDSCMKGILSVMRNGPLDDQYELKKTRNGKHRFNLRAANNQVIGTSESYETPRAMKGGIRAVMRAAITPDVRGVLS